MRFVGWFVVQCTHLLDTFRWVREITSARAWLFFNNKKPRSQLQPFGEIKQITVAHVHILPLAVCLTKRCHFCAIPAPESSCHFCAILAPAVNAQWQEIAATVRSRLDRLDRRSLVVNQDQGAVNLDRPNSVAAMVTMGVVDAKR